MAVLQAKKTPVIKKSGSYTYTPSNFKTKKNFIRAEDPADLIRKVKPFELDGRRFITFDTETHPYFKNSRHVPENIVRRWVRSGAKARPQDLPFCISICDGTNAFTIYDSMDNDFKNFKALAPLFEDQSIEKIAHNWKFDAHMLANIDMVIKGRVHDTVVLAKLVNENRRSFSLRDLVDDIPNSVVEYDYMVDSYKALNKVTDYRQIPKELMTQYANADVWNCYLEFITEYPKLEEFDLLSLYDKECELMIALYAMERYGCTVDKEYEPHLKQTLQETVDELEARIYKKAGKIFNINSTKQLYSVLLSLNANPNWIPITAKGNPSLNKRTLNKLASVHEVDIVKDILDFRKHGKLLVTYATGIYDQMDAKCRVHGNINQTEATTGRMSITKPALQTLPKKDTSIRRAFLPSDDYELWFMDLDQIEYRLFAHYAKIPRLINAIENGYDVHAATAAMIFHQDLEDFIERLNNNDKRISDMRQKGKTINFALIYGVGTKHLGEMLKCTTTQAADTRANYFAQMPEAQSFIYTTHNVIKMRGYIRNFYGRRRRLKVDECYKAPNALIQGCAADYIKERLVDMYKYILYNKLKTQLILIVHDEVVLNVHKSETSHIPVFRWLLSDFESFRCPITAGAEKGGPSWGQKIKVPDVGFLKPADDGYLNVNIYDGSVFNIYKERAM